MNSSCAYIKCRKVLVCEHDILIVNLYHTFVIFDDTIGSVIFVILDDIIGLVIFVLL